MKSRGVLKRHDFSRTANERNRFGISKQRGFRLRCFWVNGIWFYMKGMGLR